MPLRRKTAGLSGWRGVVLIAVTYIYFLIFAQFAFLKRLADLGIADTHLKAVMGSMAIGGIALSLLAPRVIAFASPVSRMRLAFLLCSAAAMCSLLPLHLAAALGIAALIGCGLGLLTVTLVTHLRQWLGSVHPLLNVGLGTGIGYFFCNFPPFFTASPGIQALVSATLCVAGIFIVRTDHDDPVSIAIQKNELQISPAPASFAHVLICFTALVWFDSAAFFIIQNTPALKAGTWEGPLHLWVNGLLHFGAALISVWILERRGLSRVFSLAFSALAVACLLLLHPEHALLASFFYPVGVSLYSVALVAYPSLLAPAASPAERGHMAGWIYAIAGWFGSAMGIGMAQHLGHVPIVFIIAAGVLVLFPRLFVLRTARRLEFVATVVVFLAAFAIYHTLPSHHAGKPDLSQAQLGRQVYIAEGCIHCHSQYVRPGTSDEVLWGPAQSVEEAHQQHPPLIGNRRQGPDLSQVGSRRSPLWLKAHLYHPAQLSPGSFMPSYAYLFRDRRGDDLVAYLQSLRSADLREHLAAEQRWRLAPASLAQANPSNGAWYFQRYCTTCHETNGTARLAWHSSFTLLPPVFPAGPYRHLAVAGPGLRNDIARIIKFGIAGTDMPGHEYLPDSQVAAISAWLTQQIAQDRKTSALDLSTSIPTNIAIHGETK